MKYLHINELNNSRLEKLLTEVDKNWGIEFILIGGSRGLKLDNENSDYDICVFLKDFDKIYSFTKRFKEYLNLDLAFMNLKYIYDNPRTIYNFKNLSMLMWNFIEEDKVLYKNDNWTFEKIKKMFSSMSKNYLEWIVTYYDEYIKEVKYNKDTSKIYANLCNFTYLLNDNLDEWYKNKEIIKRIKEFKADFNDLTYMINKLKIWQKSGIKKKEDINDIIERIISE